MYRLFLRVECGFDFCSTSSLGCCHLGVGLGLASVWPRFRYVSACHWSGVVLLSIWTGAPRFCRCYCWVLSLFVRLMHLCLLSAFVIPSLFDLGIDGLLHFLESRFQFNFRVDSDGRIPRKYFLLQEVSLCSPCCCCSRLPVKSAPPPTISVILTRILTVSSTPLVGSCFGWVWFDLWMT